MGKNDELRQNHIKMNKNNALTNKVCVTYLAVCGMILAAYIYFLFISIDLYYLLYAAHIAAILAFGYLGGYSHNNTLAIIAPTVAAAALLLTSNVIYIFLTIMSVVLLIMTIRANTVYDELSEETGFPQFDEIFEEQKARSSASERTNAEYLERLKNTSLNGMNDLSAVSGGMENKSSSQNSGFMDTI